MSDYFSSGLSTVRRNPWSLSYMGWTHKTTRGISPLVVSMIEIHLGKRRRPKPSVSYSTPGPWLKFSKFRTMGLLYCTHVLVRRTPNLRHRCLLTVTPHVRRTSNLYIQRTPADVYVEKTYCWGTNGNLWFPLTRRTLTWRCFLWRWTWQVRVDPWVFGTVTLTCPSYVELLVYLSYVSFLTRIVGSLVIRGTRSPIERSSLICCTSPTKPRRIPMDPGFWLCTDDCHTVPNKWLPRRFTVRPSQGTRHHR